MWMRWNDSPVPEEGERSAWCHTSRSKEISYILKKAKGQITGADTKLKNAEV